MYTIHLGFSGFPKGLASTQRTLLTFKGLRKAGATPLIVNKISHNQYPDNNKVKRFDGIMYINTAYFNSRPDSFLLRNMNKVSGYFGEIRFLFGKRNKIDAAILYSTYFLEYPYYFFLSKILGFKLVLQYVEMFSAIPGRSSFFTKINDKLIDRYAARLCGGVIAISDYLVAHVRKTGPDTPVIKLPANADFEAIANVQAAQTDPYLMYCGTIHYEDVIEFVVALFSRLQRDNVYAGNLLLVISGSHDQNWQKLRSFLVEQEARNQIIIKSNIPYTELVRDYKSADILLIPLRNTVQDSARFPHKVAEYTASKRPFLSTKVGELMAYFTDEQSALLADEYSIDKYYDKIKHLIKDQNKLDTIGLEGYKTGKQYFDYVAQGALLKEFIDRLATKKN